MTLLRIRHVQYVQGAWLLALRSFFSFSLLKKIFFSLQIKKNRLYSPINKNTVNTGFTDIRKTSPLDVYIEQYLLKIILSLCPVRSFFKITHKKAATNISFIAAFTRFIVYLSFVEFPSPSCFTCHLSPKGRGKRF